MNEQEISEILEKHRAWLMCEENGVRVNLQNANLRGADLRDADLRDADLRGADLRGADLRGADLRGADLQGCAGNREQIKSIFVSDVYPVTYTSDYLQIGCQNHPILDWWDFDDAAIARMDGKRALKFWRDWKDVIKMIIEKSPAEKTRSK